MHPMDSAVKIMIAVAMAITVIAVVGIIAGEIGRSNEIVACRAAGGVSVTFRESLGRHYHYELACVNPDIFVKVK